MRQERSGRLMVNLSEPEQLAEKSLTHRQVKEWGGLMEREVNEMNKVKGQG